MTNHRTIQPDARKVIVGVDTRKHVHVAVAIDTWGIRLGDRSCAADSDGYQQLITWAERHGRVAAFGIEGTGSYGAGLARAVRRAGHQVLEVNRGDRRTRRIAGKSDTVDAETAARSVLAGLHGAGGPEPDRSGGWVPSGAPFRNLRPRREGHGGVPAHPTGRRRAGHPDPEAGPERQRSRGAICAVDHVRVFEPDDVLRRSVVAARCWSIPSALPPGATAPGARERDARFRSAVHGGGASVH